MTRFFETSHSLFLINEFFEFLNFKTISKNVSKIIESFDVF